jgi:hypothetical protein
MDVPFLRLGTKPHALANLHINVHGCPPARA